MNKINLSSGKEDDMALLLCFLLKERKRSPLEFRFSIDEISIETPESNRDHFNIMFLPRNQLSTADILGKITFLRYVCDAYLKGKQDGIKETEEYYNP